MTISPNDLALDPDEVARIASKLRITNFSTGAKSLWVPNQEQIDVWRAGVKHKKRYITKARRIGISTALDLEDVLWTNACDQAGHQVTCGMVIHTEDKVKRRIEEMSNFMNQLGIVHEAYTLRLKFPRGSVIEGITANADTRTSGYQKIRWEEFAFYPAGAYMAISPSVGEGAPETICTTIDIAAASGALARDIYRGKNEFYKMFFPFSDHAVYRADPNSINEDEWAWCQSEGFKDDQRAQAAYWIGLLQNKMGGQRIKLFREYPQKPEHMFQAAEGRWVSITPEVLTPVDTITVIGKTGDPLTSKIYVKPQDTSHEIAIAIDTATPSNRDRSAIAVVDRVTGKLCASFVSGFVFMDDLVSVAQTLFWEYTYTSGREIVTQPIVLIEENGIGEGTCQAAKRLNLPFNAQWTDQNSKHSNLLLAKRAIETLVLCGPEELAEECDELVVNPKNEDFKGRKDLMMCYGMCASYNEKNPASRRYQQKEKTVLTSGVVRRRKFRRKDPVWGTML